MFSPSVIIRDLDLMRSVSYPDKTDPPLIIDPDTVLADPSPLQSFQSVACRREEVFQVRRVVEHREFPLRDLSEAGKLLHHLAGEELLRLLVPKPSNHDIHPITVLRFTYSVCAKYVLKLYKMAHTLENQ